MRRIIVFFFFCACLINAGAKTIGPGFGVAEIFNQGWLFSLSDNEEYKSPGFDDKSWRKLSLPHDWSVEGKLSTENASCTGYLPAGIGWYRKHFKWNDDKKKPLSFIYFEGVYNRSEVYLNGHLLGKRPNGYISFLYELTPFLVKGDNVISVRVDHSRIADSRWYTGSGIYRDVYFVKSPVVHLRQWGTTYCLKSLENNTAQVHITGGIDRPVDKDLHDYCLRVVIKDMEEHVVVSKDIQASEFTDGNFAADVLIDNPSLWSIDNPYLYSLSVGLFENNSQIDAVDIAMGLRTLHFDPDYGFSLNGNNMKVKGVCLHHDAGVLGAAVPEQVWRRRIREIKRMGANAIRMSHNVQAPVLYDICDEEGLLVMDEGSDEWEFPKRKWVKGWNVGEPAFDGSFDFFEEWIERDVRDMVLRDRNHPCVFLWSVGNEVDYPNDPYSHPVLNGTTINQPMFGGYKPDAPKAERIGMIAQRLADVIRSSDKSRPVTGALAGVVMSNQTIYPDVIDVVGYNYTENRYAQDHAEYPKRVIYGSETSTRVDAWKAVKDNDFIFGQFVWTGLDYLGESGRWPSRGLNTGLLDFGAFRKQGGFMRAVLWSEQPEIFITTTQLLRGRHNRPSREYFDLWDFPGHIVQVTVHTNQPKARLVLNGKEVDNTQDTYGLTGEASWDVEFQSGTLVAQALDESGNVVAEYKVVTPKLPYALEVEDLTADGLSKSQVAENADLLQLNVRIIDDEGNLVANSKNEITCQIKGDADLLGLEASNNTDMSDYTDNKHNAYKGHILAYIRKNTNKKIKITFSSPGLKSVTIEK